MNKIKVIYSGQFFNEWGYENYLLNGYHFEVRKLMAQEFAAKNYLNLPAIHNAIDADNPDLSWRSFTSHGNFLHYYKKHRSRDDVVMPEQVINDGSIYLYPIESCYSIENLLEEYSLKLNGNEYRYNLLDIIDTSVLEGIKQGYVKLLINIIHDPVEHPEFLNRLENYLMNHGIAAENVVIIGGNRYNDYYTKYPNGKLKFTNGYLLINQIKDKADEFNNLMVGSLGYKSAIVTEQDLDPARIRPKKFICLNRNLHRAHRWVMAYFAIKHNLIENSIFSFIVRHGADAQRIKNTISHFLGPGDYDDIAGRIDQLVPLEIDTNAISNKNGFSLNNNKKDFYINSYINLVTETSFEHGDSHSPFISEKTLVNPILNLQPFICMGNSFTLKTLIEFGFKTFHPYIDESYDSCIDFRQRIKLIEKEIIRLNSLSQQELHNLYYSMTDILIHNQQHAMTLTNHDPFETAFNDIRNWYGSQE